MPLPPIRRTARMELHPLTIEHSSGMFGMWSAADVCQFSAQAHDQFGNLIALPARTRADSDKIIEFFTSRSEAGLGFRWAMLENISGRFFGAVGFNHLRPNAEIAYHLTPSAWGQGYAIEAVQEALRWLAENKVGQVEAWIDPENRRSIALIERANFTPTGVTNDGATQFVRQLG